MWWDLLFWTALNSSSKTHILYCLQVYIDPTLIIIYVYLTLESSIILISTNQIMMLRRAPVPALEEALLDEVLFFQNWF